MKFEEGDTVAVERDQKSSCPDHDEGTKRKPRFGTMKDKIKILDPNWDAPQNDEAGWLAGDV